MTTADAPLPRPTSVRLHAPRAHAAPARAPFGLGWGDASAEAIVVPLDATESVAALAEQLPDPSSLARGTLVVAVAGEAPRGLLGRLFTRSATISRRARATALLVRGYVAIAAANDAASDLDLVWAYAP
jgi:hypothetical protein